MDKYYVPASAAATCRNGERRGETAAALVAAAALARARGGERGGAGRRENKERVKYLGLGCDVFLPRVVSSLDAHTAHPSGGWGVGDCSQPAGSITESTRKLKGATAPTSDSN
jgi:hypothetical protein